MASVFIIAWKDLKLRVRDRSVFIMGLIAPLVLAVIFDLVFGNALGGDSSFSPSYGLVVADQGGPGEAFGQALDEIAAGGLIEVTRYDDPVTAEQAVEDGEMDAVFIVPAGFDQAVAAGQPATVEVVGSLDSPTAGQIAGSIAEGFALGIEEVQLSFATAVAAGANPVEMFSELTGTDRPDPPVVLGEIDAAVRQLDGTTFAMAGMAAFFLFFTVQFGVGSLLDERRDGTLMRLKAAPIPRWAVIAAKGLVSFVLGLVSMGVLMVAAWLLLGADWGPPIPVALLVVAGVLSAVGVTLVVAAAANTPESAGNIQAIVAVTLGILGGTFFPIQQDGGWLAAASLLTPHAWFLRGLGDLAGGGGVAAVWPSVLAMTGFALVTGGLGWAFLNRGEGR